MRSACLAGFVFLEVFAAGGLPGQTSTPPNAYTVTQAGNMLSPTTTIITYRDGSRAVIDLITPAAEPGAKAQHTRALYDLQASTNRAWDADDPAATCSTSRYSGSWGDPFADSKEMAAQLAGGQVKEVGTEPVNGMAAKVLEMADPRIGKIKAWIDTKYGLILKAQMTGLDGKTKTMFEVKQVSFTAPPASIFTLPAACRNQVDTPPPPTEAQRIAAETSGKGDNYVSAITGPGSANSCTMLVKFVQAGSMQPITSGFQFAFDPTYDVDHPPSFETGVGVDGHLTFKGGGIKELTAEFRNGVLRIDNVPKQFYVNAAFGNGGETGGLLYRKCSKPQTELLVVVKNPAKLADGADWLWAK